VLDAEVEDLDDFRRNPALYGAVDEATRQQFSAGMVRDLVDSLQIRKDGGIGQAMVLIKFLTAVRGGGTIQHYMRIPFTEAPLPSQNPVVHAWKGIMMGIINGRIKYEQVCEIPLNVQPQSMSGIEEVFDGDVDMEALSLGQSDDEDQTVAMRD
jgi:hypothetical protein